jgi:hypothetical protein
MLVRLLAAVTLALVLWWVFRLAMGLRWAKIERDRARAREEEGGRRIVAELPLPDGVVLVVEDAGRLTWGGQGVVKQDLLGGRLLLNSAVVGTVSRAGATLPPPPEAEPEEGREVWEVVVYLVDGTWRSIPCGRVREGVSRDAARAVLDAVRREVQR